MFNSFRISESQFVVLSLFFCNFPLTNKSQFRNEITVPEVTSFLMGTSQTINSNGFDELCFFIYL